MASPGGHEYDEHLLSEAPKPDRRALQEGYDPTLLTQQERKPEKHRSSTPRQTSTPTPGPGSPIDRDRDVEKGLVAAGTTAGAPPRHSASARATPIAAPNKPLTKSKPFYKTKKGLLIIGGVLIAIIIAAVVGGVVGGRKKSSPNQETATAPSSADPTGTSTSAAPGSTTQGSGLPDVGGQVGAGGSQSGQGGGSNGQGGQDTAPPSTSAPLPITGLGGAFTQTAEQGQPTISGLPPLRR